MEQLTSDQIQTIDAFVKERYIHYEDVRIEIVDHLATEIEAERINKPNESFGILLYKAAGRNESILKTIIKVSEKELRWYWIKLLPKEFVKSFFSAYMLVPIAMFFAIVFLSSVVSGLLLNLVSFILYSVVLGILSYLMKGQVDSLYLMQERNHLLASRTFVDLFLIVSGVSFLVLLITIGLVLSFGDFLNEAIAYAVVWSLAIVLKMFQIKGVLLLNGYYQKYPAIVNKRTAYIKEFANRQWQDKWDDTFEF